MASDVAVVNGNYTEGSQVSDAWNVLISWMEPKSLLHEPSDLVVASFEYIQAFEQELIKHYVNLVRSHFFTYAAPQIAQSLEYQDEAEGIAQLASVLSDARKHYAYPISFMPLSDESIVLFERAFSSLVRASLSPSTFTEYFKQFFKKHPIHSLAQPQIDLCHTLAECGLADNLEKLYGQVLVSEVLDYVSSTYAGQWEDGVFDSFKVWLSSQVLPLLQLLLGQDETEHLEPTLVQLGGDAIVNLRITELFDIIVHYPDSLGAILDLKNLMNKSSQRANAVSTFQSACTKRLLQGGTNTVEILKTYVSTIRAFTVLEPRGVLLDRVSRPIRRYLRDRDDTIRTIVSGLLGEEDSEMKDLAQELASKSGSRMDSSEGDDLTDLNWKPDPVDAPPDFMKGSLTDIIGSLVSLFDNKDIFIKEFVNIFAERLLRSDSNVEDIIVDLERLKVLFGEQEMLKLDVMVRDITESKRVNVGVHAVPNLRVAKKVRAKVLSKLYWPSLPAHDVEIPGPIEDQLAMYAQAFSKIKRGRKLKWARNLGTVKIELQLEDRVVTLDVTPEQSAVIAFFQKGPKSIADVSERFGMDETKARQVIMFWVSKSILRQNGDKYQVIERLDEANDSTAALDDAGADSGLLSAAERSNEEMQLYWSYIVGMLTNLGTMPVERIHSFLKMLVPKDNPYTKSQDELEQYLNAMVVEEKLEFTGDGFKLLSK